MHGNIINISNDISIVFSDHIRTFSRCSFERKYVPCDEGSLEKLETDLAICQHESTVTPPNSVVELSRNQNTYYLSPFLQDINIRTYKIRFFISFMILASIGCGYLSNATTSAFQYSSPFMTIQFCLEVCKGEGLNIAFIRGELCQCEMSTENLQMLPQHFCSNESSCPGNPLQTCGIQEKNIFSVYEAVAPTFSNSQITGRYLFSITIRAYPSKIY